VWQGSAGDRRPYADQSQITARYCLLGGYALWPALADKTGARSACLTESAWLLSGRSGLTVRLDPSPIPHSQDLSGREPSFREIRLFGNDRLPPPKESAHLIVMLPGGLVCPATLSKTWASPGGIAAGIVMLT
jgi:hypothetical protein